MRIPLHIKLMVSYLLVVGLVFVPTVIYLGTIQRAQLRASQERELQKEATLVAERLARTSAAELRTTVELVVGLLSQRVTILDAEGRVLGDTFTRGPLDSHADRPEVIAALATGLGIAERRSSTTGEQLLYVATRYPAHGPPRGVVRLAVPTRAIDESGAQSTTFLNRAGAVALSAAVLLSLIASLVVSRPLRRIAQGARAFAAGDFGHPVDVRTQDELEEAARALEDLGAQLRDRLLAAGADRAALHALADELPVGVILYDTRYEPVLVNGPARVLCGLDASHEVERARELTRLPGHAEAIRRVLDRGGSESLALKTPWSNPPFVRARWVVMYASDGTRQPALVVDDASLSSRQETLLAALSSASEMLSRGARALGDTDLGNRLRRAAEASQSLVPLAPARPQDVETLPLAQLFAQVLEELEAARRSSVELDLDDEQVAVVDAGGRTRRAVRDFVRSALDHVPIGEPLQITSEPAEARVRLVVRTSGVPHGLKQAAGDLRSLGGDAGWERDGDATEAWLFVPRA